MPSTQPAIQKPNFDVFGEKSQKINCKAFHGETYFAYFCQFFHNLLSKIVRGNKFSFLTWFRPLDFTFSEDFIVSKDPFALQTDT